MTDAPDPRDQLRQNLRELADLRREKAAAERARADRPALIGHALTPARLPPSVNFGALGLMPDPDLALPLRPLLAAAWEALEHAGRPPATLPKERVGVFIGLGGSQPLVGAAQALARALGLRGPALNVEAGDASALAALDLAGRSLLAHDVDLALAGGVAQPEEAGLVVLKRLSDAVEQRDHIIAVIEAQRVGVLPAAPPDVPALVAALTGRAPAAVRAVGLPDPAPGGHLAGLAALVEACATFTPDAPTVVLAADRANWAGLALRVGAPPPNTDQPVPHLLLLSAPSETALAESASRLAAHLRARPDTPLAEVAYTLRAGRAALTHRRYHVVADHAAAVAALEAPAPRSAVSAAVAPPPVFLFPGLGSHYVNMAAGLYQDEPIFRAAVDECARLLEPHLGLNIRALFLMTPSGPAAPPAAGGLDLRKLLRRAEAAPDPAVARLDQTIHAQPALFAVEYALARLLTAWGLRPAALLGYSLGEYVAACLAGVLSLPDALALVAARARLIQALPPGQMLAVPLSEAELAPWLADDVSVSGVIGHAVCVVAGPPEAVTALAARLAAAAIAATTLPTTHAFHTPLLRPIAAPFAAALRSVRLQPPAVPYLSNLTGTWITAAEATSPEYWVEHSCRPVQFARGIETLHHAGYGLLLEVGPAQALTGLIPALARDLDAPALRAVPTMRAAYETTPDAAALQRALGELWLAGVAADWEAFHPARRVPLPPTVLSGVGVPSTALAADLATPPATPTVVALAGLWCELLKLPAADPRQTFFEQGGNSLLAAQLIYRIRKTFGVTLPLRALYEAPGLDAMARLIDGRAAPAAGNGHAPPPSPGLPLTLPNGLEIMGVNPQEVAHFYEDIFVNQVYVSHGIALPPDVVVFDVGANIGLFSLYVHTQALGARVFSFEPAPPLFRLLQANLARHGVAGAAYNCALSHAAGTAEFTFYPKSTGMSSLYADLADEQAVLTTVLQNQLRRGEQELAMLLDHAGDYLAERFRAETFTCPLRPLSDVIAETGVERIDLLKVDVQKAELDVLLGLADADWPKVRQVVVEVHDTDGRLAHLSRMLTERGFQVTTDQEALYAGSAIYLLYGTRPSGA
ncbi:MAG: FkbM family methyltransferase [Anaerolineales bacterium]|nr:FkbM family methyltransferase [Anaerolineales bacterium]